MSRSIRLLALPALAAVLVALPVGSASAATCSVKGKERRLGTTYVTKLSQKGTSCSKAEGVVKAFHACRKKNGDDDGKCKSKVKGYRCSEKRPSNLKTPTSYDGDVSCKNGSRSVKFHYQQNT